MTRVCPFQLKQDWNEHGHFISDLKDTRLSSLLFANIRHAEKTGATETDESAS